MGEMADLLDDQIFNEQNFMESHRYVGTRFKYKHTDGKTYHFKTLKEAQEWAKRKGFKLSTKPTLESGGREMTTFTTSTWGGAFNYVIVPAYQPVCAKPVERRPFLFDKKPVIKPFNRKDLKNSRRFLAQIRRPGAARRWRIDNPMARGPSFHIESMAFKLIKQLPIGEVLLDAGCGESPDADLALELGYKKAVGVDIFPIIAKPKADFIKADICKQLPLEDESVDTISSNWVMPLLSPSDRLLFYQEAYRLLKPGGYLIITGGTLACGHEPYAPGFRVTAEKQRLIEAGFTLGNGIAQKSAPKGKS